VAAAAFTEGETMAEIAMHGHGVRGMDRKALHSFSGIGDPGKFGIMFPDLIPLFAPDDALLALAKAMEEAPLASGDPDPEGDNPDIPAGYTYLGQFIDHDITLDTTPLAQQNADVKATTNFRTPALDLDSVYGDGPGIHPYLYQRDPLTFRVTEKLLIGHAANSRDVEEPTRVPKLPNDLPRNQVGHALIFDERNDENLLVAQMHLLMLQFHNKVIDWLKDNGSTLEGERLFKEARRIVTWHYQWIVLFDFVERLTEKGLVGKIKEAGRKFYRFKKTPYMPAEFAAGAYRCGHTMVRETYSHNRIFRPGTGPKLANGTLPLLFLFTGKSGLIIGELAPTPPEDPPAPQATLPSNWVIDWRRFFELGLPTADEGFSFNHSRKLDPLITKALHTLPGLREDMTETQQREFVLPFRNLRRGVQIGLPSGQDVCRAMKLTPLTPEEIADCHAGDVAKLHGLHVATPLWYYVLCEAQHHGKGKRLGPMASTIVAETFLGMIHGDEESFLFLRSNWKPELPAAKQGEFTMADLIRFVDDINPIDKVPA
jgi:hypothetical protein